MYKNTAPETTGVSITAEEYQSRRKAFLARLLPDSVALFPSAATKLRNGDDNTFDFRQSSDVLYLTGLSEPHSVVVLSNIGGKETLTVFVAPRDPAQERWHGVRLGIEGAKSALQADSAYDIGTLPSRLRSILKAASHVYVGKYSDEALEKQIAHAAIKAGHSKYRLRNATAVLAELRLVKSQGELALMRRSAQIAAHAHQAAMLQCRPGMIETDLKSVIEHVFAANGCAGPSYGTIVANGANGLCLHYPAGPDTLEHGKLVLIDAGAEFSGYASDITRVFPVSGKFTAAQRAIYEVVLAGQLAAIKAIKAGATWTALNRACDNEITTRLAALGFKLAPAGKAGEKSKRLKLDDIYPHGLGHWLGLDVHDVGEKEIRVAGKKQQRKLVPGMVLTIEPGLYLPTDDERIPAEYRGICVRIEDDIVVSEDGAEVLTADIVKSVREIEALMAKGASARDDNDPFKSVVPVRVPTRD